MKMNSSFSTLPLMSGVTNDADADKVANKTFNLYDCNDSSSGYDSTDISDVDSVTSLELCDTAPDDSRNNFLQIDEKAEEMNYQSKHALCEHLKLILSMPEMCDVTFLVGPREVPVHGVRAVMGTRSRIMYQLLLKHMSEKVVDEEREAKKKRKSKKNTCSESVGIGRSLSQRLVIPVKKYDSEVFRMLVQFIHCGSVNINEDTVAGLFCAASHFELSDLYRACLDYVERCIYSVLDERYVARLEETFV